MHHLADGEAKKPTGPHVVAQQRYYEARQRADLAKRVYSEAYRSQKDAEQKLVETMMELGINSMSYMEDGTAIHFRANCTISVTQENEEPTREWLREQYGDDEQFSKDSLDKPAIIAQIKADLASGNLSETEVPDHMSLSQFPAISVSGWKKR